jgi:Na+/H+ antiporter NhaC
VAPSRTSERAAARVVIAMYVFVGGFCLYLAMRNILDMIDGASLTLGLFFTFLLALMVAWNRWRIQISLVRLRGLEDSQTGSRGASEL